MGSSVKKAIKRIAIVVIVVVAIVFVAVVAVYALGLAASVGLPAASAATLGGYASAAATVAINTISNPAFIMAMGVGAYQSYAVDKEKMEAMSQVSQAEREAEAGVRDHFSQMEDDRYENYDGPKLGIAFTEDEEKRFDSSLADSPFNWVMGLLIGAGVLTAVAYG